MMHTRVISQFVLVFAGAASTAVAQGARVTRADSLTTRRDTLESVVVRATRAPVAPAAARADDGAECFEITNYRSIAEHPQTAALGIIRIVNVHMEVDLRLTLGERGLDPRRFALLSFGGGAAKLYHSSRCAHSLGRPAVTAWRGAITRTVAP